jgi:hypothetical protein
MWFDQCRFTACIDRRVIDNITNIYLTRCTVESLRLGCMASGVYNSNWRLIRGNDFSNLLGRWLPSVFPGNYRGGTTQGMFQTGDVGDVPCDRPTYPIIAFNKLMLEGTIGGYDVISLFSPGAATRNANGFAVVQNLIEFTDGRGGRGALHVHWLEFAVPR